MKKSSSNLDDFCKTRTIDKNQPKCNPRFTIYTRLGIEAGLGIRGDYFIELLKLVEQRENELPNYQQAYHIAKYHDRLGINHLVEQKRCDFLIGFMQTISKRIAEINNAEYNSKFCDCFVSNIADLRHSKNISQIKMSHAIGLSQSKLCETEQGKRRLRFNEALKIMDYLGCDYDDFKKVIS